MGLENGLLMDSQLSASSSYSLKFTPDLARLGSDSVWASAVQDDNQYLQVNNLILYIFYFYYYIVLFFTA